MKETLNFFAPRENYESGLKSIFCARVKRGAIFSLMLKFAKFTKFATDFEFCVQTFLVKRTARGFEGFPMIVGTVASRSGGEIILQSKNIEV